MVQLATSAYLGRYSSKYLSTQGLRYRRLLGYYRLPYLSFRSTSNYGYRCFNIERKLESDSKILE